MSKLLWLPWMARNRNHQWLRGPVFAAWGGVLTGVQAREQGNFGVVDLAFCARDLEEVKALATGEDVWFPWVTRNESYHWERPSSVAPEGHVLAGFDVKEQGGFGLVDIRCIYRCLGDGALVEGGWLCGNTNGNEIRSIVPDDHGVVGVDVREQGGFGVIDLRIASHPL